MKVELTGKLKALYPNTKFGSLIVKNVPNKRNNKTLEEKKRGLEGEIRESGADKSEDSIIQSYNNHFKRWGKSYPIEFQIKSIKEGKKFPHVSILVDSMFLAEIKNRILTSGHDLDTIQGTLTFDVLEGTEKYLKLNNQEQKVKKEDVCLRDEAGILASVLYGPAKRTTISSTTMNALYFAWCPYKIDEELITTHLNDILSNLREEFGEIDSEIYIHK